MTPDRSASPNADLLSALATHPTWRGALDFVTRYGSLSLALRGPRITTLRRGGYGAPVHDRDGLVGHVVASATRRALTAAEQSLVDYFAQALTSTCRQMRNAQRQARLIEEQQAMVDHIADGLLVLEPGTVVRHINKTAARLLHLKPEAAIGRPLASLVDFETVVEPLFESGVGYVDRELIISSPTLQLHLMDTAIPIKDESGAVVSIVNTFREIQRVRTLVQHIAGSHARYGFEHIIGHSAELMTAIGAARKAALGKANVLLSGESGVGKEMFAQAIHNASPRREGAFIALNCAALPRDLIESELFGYAAGSFTGARREGRPGKFEAASGGTIFLDEISELPIDVQAKLLRVLQEREVVRVGDTRGIPIDVRVVSASNRNLRALVATRTFREDLYYRCNVIELELPALRSRPSDIPVLAHHFLAKYAALLDRPVYGISAAAMLRLQRHPWPGNVRELENAIERIVNLCDHQEIDEQDLGMAAASDPSVVNLAVQGAGPPMPLAAVEREAIVAALTHTGHNMTRCAQLLEISKPALYAKVKRHGIRLERRR